MFDKIADALTSRLFLFLAVPVAVLVWFVATDPSHGADTMLRLQLWAQALLVVGMTYAITKSLLGKASSQALYDQAVAEKNIAAGVAYLGVCLLRALTLIGLLVFFGMVQR